LSALRGNVTLANGVMTVLEIVLLLATSFAGALISAQIVQLVHTPRVVGYLAIGITSRYVVLWLSNGVFLQETTRLARKSPC
jgi:hypothetical protein